MTARTSTTVLVDAVVVRFEAQEEILSALAKSFDDDAPSVAVESVDDWFRWWQRTRRRLDVTLAQVKENLALAWQAEQQRSSGGGG